MSLTASPESDGENRSVGSTTTQDDWQDKEASCDSKLKAVFDEEIGKHKKNRFTFHKAAVLLLSWAEDFDDLKTGPEVNELERVFKDVLNFETRRKLLGHADKTAQAQVNFFISSFVHDYDDSGTILIVYYAGHGSQSESKDGLLLKGDKSSNSSERGEIVWNSVDGIIKQTKSHVLVIFDCCHAGALQDSYRGDPTRAFEYLAATTESGTTRQPGPRSFTTALISALQSLVKRRKSFLISELLQCIINQPGFPEDQFPMLLERPLLRAPGPRLKIMLAPLNTMEDINEPQIEENTGEPLRSTTLALRFVFKNDLLHEDLVRKLAAGISNLVGSENFPPTTVLWDGSQVGSLPRLETSMLPASPSEAIVLPVTTPDQITSDIDSSLPLDAEHSGADTVPTTPSESDLGLARTTDLQKSKCFSR
ncbi:hypothetical protein BJ875DRAFT_493326 [Amylocarpus encephaloides]|uniref:Peptidase C14 caspase domain-containing protein n=1 Tax=Amylocarpus encephaloides TaxID=45428 RepID=A0A9P7YPF1_9HELO|nr:hypothetical protein BJ875DRAFT_493326 [Amylocarpus encephaloides]